MDARQWARVFHAGCGAIISRTDDASIALAIALDSMADEAEAIAVEAETVVT